MYEHVHTSHTYTYSASNQYLGPLLYISFLFIAFFVMLNMFLAIIAKVEILKSQLATQLTIESDDEADF